ncbi:LCP family protein [Anaerolentibacter hominis]|uniref:LCP family protein n=1 Tax=Anaerolentibacter hominis TaxID=3079009 RepID=UPI0031B83282
MGIIRRKHRSILSVVLEIIFILVILLIMFIVFKLFQIPKADIPADAVITNDLSEKTEQNLEDYQNIALFGVDSRENELKQNTRSDTIMVASINKKTKEVKLVSIYRDTYVYIDNEHGYNKINHAYSYGGPELAINTINQNFDLNITDFITVNFNSLAEIVDALGGVTIDIQKDEIKEVNRYTKDVAKILDKKGGKIKEAGSQKLNGVQATAYCRVRKTSGGDYRRSERQRAVLSAIVDEVKKANPIKLLSIINTVFPHIYTSLSVKDILFMAPGAFSYKLVSTEGFPFEKEGRTVNKTSYVFPLKSLDENVSKLHKHLFGTKKYSPSSQVKSYSKKISQVYSTGK